MPSIDNASDRTTALVADITRRIAHASVYGSAVRTPLDKAERLSSRLDNTVLLKREDLQPVFSFKCRGAENRIAQLGAAGPSGGVVCSSAGNHAQGVALAAQRRGLRAVVVMPKNTAEIKVDAVTRLGAEILLEGDTYDAANAKALEIAETARLEFIHPFADLDVIAGQGTIAREIARTWSAPPLAVFVPVGGGGLICGIGVYLKQYHPEVRVIGVEPRDAAGMHAALEAGQPVSLDRVGTFADGVAVRRVSDETFLVGSHVIDEIVLVDTDEICAGIRDVFEDFRVVIEPAGALAVAGMKRYVRQRGIAAATLIAIASGANMDFTRLRHVAERAAVGEHREALLGVAIPEEKGAFLRFCQDLGERNITEFNYRYSATERAEIFVGVSLRGGEGAADIVALLEGKSYTVTDLTRDEVAKLHIRHTVGGLRSDLANEQLYRFEFPERPGALLAFLTAVGTEWNITMFHYRNHGSDYGRVLVGVDLPDAELPDFEQHIQTLGFPHWIETGNPAFGLFLNESRRT